MRKLFDLSLAPLYAFIIAVVLAHGGNDKAPFLVLGAALLSMVFCFAYLIQRRSMRKVLITGFPFILTGALFILARLHIIDIYPILGFR